MVGTPRTALSDEPLRDDLSRRGLERARSFRWEDLADATLVVPARRRAMSGSSWSGRRVLVTGATGTAGSWLVKELLARDAIVAALVLDLDPQSEVVRSGDLDRCSVVNGRLEDVSAVERAVTSTASTRCSTWVRRRSSASPTGAPFERVGIERQGDVHAARDVQATRRPRGACDRRVE